MKKFLKILPYILGSLAIIGLVFLGSLDKNDSSVSNISMSAMAENDYNVTTDQLTEMYVVANLSNTINLASVDSVSNNYVTVSVMKDIGQTTAEKIEKPTIVDTSNISRGTIVITVQDGETLASIAKKYGLTIDQIRWSNGLKTDEIAPGNNLRLPSVPGIVYTVKAGDTLELIASKYGSNKEEIISVNDLEDNESVAEGTQLVLPGGVLPETERPEYVAPSTRRSTTSTSSYNYSYSYTYYGSTSDRQNLHSVSESLTYDAGNKSAAGQCTWYAWWWRAHSPSSLGALPSASLGNARDWARTLAGYGYRVDKTPQVGAVFQTTSGWYGHVGVVTGINSDGSLTVREMNYGRAYRITEGVIPANIVGNFNYIH